MMMKETHVVGADSETSSIDVTKAGTDGFVLPRSGTNQGDTVVSTFRTFPTLILMLSHTGT